MVCHWDDQYYDNLFIYEIYEIITDTVLGITLTIALIIITCNVVSLIVLCTRRNQTLNESRTNVVNTFKQLTLWTGLLPIPSGYSVFWLF